MSEKSIGAVILGVCILFTIVSIASPFMNALKWDNEVGSYVDLADKSSNLQVKYDYILKYRDALEEKGLNEGYSNPIWKTPTENLGENFNAIESLVSRMNEIRELETNSAEYQWALSQITEEEIPHIAGTCSTENCGNYDHIFFSGWNYQRGGGAWFWYAGGFLLLTLIAIIGILVGVKMIIDW